ncbi:hypothetical protein AbraIFM66951_004109 [Aspergillus brasiliensis]|uniref:Insecticidal crystal toxin domain-containing protein n=1 Tax=Aspergillus brasiliensis TaxID=319629 RepID=A0A9W5Z1X4_9EURO|nr:hypothetical protein AbraCBS73388_003533 [Aspergillus brasiliensis]GKZ50745.1 hypothetical protein AbraIFM66951_004109 [Aspergillus brasiliensis]
MANKTYAYGELVVTLTSKFDDIWNDAGSGATRDGGFWHPISQVTTQGTLRPLGSMAVGNFKELNGQRAALLIGAKSSSSSNPPVKAPTGYTQLWVDKNSGAKRDGSFWRPIAPSGYIAMGDVVQSGWTMPSTSKVWCVRSDLVADGQYADESVWDDNMSGVGGNVSIWEVYPYPNNISGSEFLPVVAGTFRAMTDAPHSVKPDLGYAVVPTLKIPRDFAEFTDPTPTFTASTIPSTGTTYTWVGQCEVTLPFTSFYSDTDQRSLQLISNPFCKLNRSITWYVEGSYINNSAGTIRRSKQVTTGVSSAQSTELAHNTGVAIESKAGIWLVKLKVNLNYQFSHTSSSTNEEYQEETITTEFDVPSYHATVVFSKRVRIKAQRADGSIVTGQLDFGINEDTHLAGVEL